MRATVRALMDNLIDYAGMFPPARLPMGEALRHYTRLAAAPEAWMLGRFVCPAAKLGDLLDLARAEGAPTPLRVTALGRGGRDLGELRDNLDSDLAAIDDFHHELDADGTVDAIELTLPPAPPQAELADLVATGLPPAGLRTFLEIPLGPTWQDDVQTVCQELSARPGPATPDRPGLKIRCGGTATPAPLDLAFFIAECRDNHIAWKATAGLHHPLPHHDPATQTLAHGFLNVFLAGILAQVHSLDEEPLTALLREESAAALRFTDERIEWRDWSCTIDQVREARAWLPSFGSCSFDEPRDDLRALGLID